MVGDRGSLVAHARQAGEPMTERDISIRVIDCHSSDFYRPEIAHDGLGYPLRSVHGGARDSMCQT